MLLKTTYAFGLRPDAESRCSSSRISKPRAPEFGPYGVCSVRYGKAAKGSPPRQQERAHGDGLVRRDAHRMGRAHPPRLRRGCGHDAVADRTGRAHLGHGGERPLRLLPRTRSASTRCSRRTACATATSPTCLEDGFDQLFVQSQVGHRWGSSDPRDTPRLARTSCKPRSPGRSARRSASPPEEEAMANLGYRWNLRLVMANHGMFQTTDLVPLLAGTGSRSLRRGLSARHPDARASATPDADGAVRHLLLHAERPDRAGRRTGTAAGCWRHAIGGELAERPRAWPEITKELASRYRCRQLRPLGPAPLPRTKKAGILLNCAQILAALPCGTCGELRRADRAPTALAGRSASDARQGVEIGRFDAACRVEVLNTVAHADPTFRTARRARARHRRRVDPIAAPIRLSDPTPRY